MENPDAQYLKNILFFILYVFIPLAIIILVGYLFNMEILWATNTLVITGILLMSAYIDAKTNTGAIRWSAFSKDMRDKIVFSVTLAVALFLVSIPDNLKHYYGLSDSLHILWTLFSILLSYLVVRIFVTLFGSEVLKQALIKGKSGGG